MNDNIADASSEKENKLLNWCCNTSFIDRGIQTTKEQNHDISALTAEMVSCGWKKFEREQKRKKISCCLNFMTTVSSSLSKSIINLSLLIRIVLNFNNMTVNNSSENGNLNG